MKKFLLIGLSFLVMGMGGFVDGLEDLPLAPNWQQAKEETISFGNVQTNFVEIYLESKTESFEKAIAFYKKTLPQLGWNYNGENSGDYNFTREKETLNIKNINKMARITVKSSN